LVEFVGKEDLEDATVFYLLMVSENQSKWLKYLFSTEPSDRPRAEAALRAFYPAVICSPAPSYVFWFESPARAAWALHLLASSSDEMYGRFVETKARDSEGRLFLEGLRAELSDKAGLDWNELAKIAGRPRMQQTEWNPQRIALHGLRPPPVKDPQYAEYRQTARLLLSGPAKEDAMRRLEDRFHEAILSACGGLGISLQHNLQSPYTFAKIAQDEQKTLSDRGEPPPAIAAAWDLAQSAGECWPLEGAVVLLERPAELHFNSEMLLHCDDGPAGTFRDGTKIWAWSGTVTTEQFILHPEDIPQHEWTKHRKVLDPEFVARIEKRRAAPTKAAPKKNVRTPAFLDAEKLVGRYQSGECAAVWKDLVALGPDVRKPPYDAAARAVAAETMRRVKHNYELVVNRLRGLDYEFEVDPDAPRERIDPIRGPMHTPPPDTEHLAACEEAGLLIPLAVHSFVQEVEAVELLGTHRLLCPAGKAAIADPALVQLSPFFYQNMLSEWAERDPGDVFLLELCASARCKDLIMSGNMAEEWFAIQLPNGSADAVLVGDPEGRSFVEYLRWSFQWGGFPGWEKQKDRPERELAFLRDELLPI